MPGSGPQYVIAEHPAAGSAPRPAVSFAHPSRLPGHPARSLFFAVDGDGLPAWTVPESECRIGPPLGTPEVFISANGSLWADASQKAGTAPGMSFICLLAVCKMAADPSLPPERAVALAREDNDSIAVSMDIFLERHYGLLVSGD